MWPTLPSRRCILYYYMHPSVEFSSPPSPSIAEPSPSSDSLMTAVPLLSSMSPSGSFHEASSSGSSGGPQITLQPSSSSGLHGKNSHSAAASNFKKKSPTSSLIYVDRHWRQVPLVFALMVTVGAIYACTNAADFTTVTKPQYWQDECARLHATNAPTRSLLAAFVHA